MDEDDDKFSVLIWTWTVMLTYWRNMLHVW